MFKWLRDNLEYIKVINSCDFGSFKTFMAGLIDSTDKTVEGVRRLFTRRRYVWNWMRGKDFYKSMAMFVIALAQAGAIEQAHHILACVVKTSPSGNREDIKHDIRRFFVKSIMLKTPMISPITVEFMSEERLDELINTEKLNDVVYISPEYKPFVDRIKELSKIKPITLTELRRLRDDV